MEIKTTKISQLIQKWIHDLRPKNIVLIMKNAIPSKRNLNRNSVHINRINIMIATYYGESYVTNEL